MATSTFADYTQTRTVIGGINSWVAVVLPVGARNALLMLEDQTAVMRVSEVNTVAAASQGSVVLAGGSYQFEGTSVAAITFYVASDKATTAILQYTSGGS